VPVYMPTTVLPVCSSSKHIIISAFFPPLEYFDQTRMIASDLVSAKTARAATLRNVALRVD
jgi:hypothetical protein